MKLTGAFLTLLGLVSAEDNVTAETTHNRCGVSPYPPVTIFDKLRDCLRAGGNIPVLFPGNPDYLEAVTPLNLQYLVHAPLIVVIPKNRDQVAQAVRCSKGFTVVVRDLFDLVNYGFPVYNGDILMDMSMLSHVHTHNNTATIGAGAVAEQVLNALGTSATLAMPFRAGEKYASFIQDGGFGPIAREYGLASDALKRAWIVDGRGNIIDTHNVPRDLFRAIRGGGRSNFGIVTDIEVELKPARAVTTMVNVEYEVVYLEHVIQKVTNFLQTASTLITPIIEITNTKIKLQAIVLADGRTARDLVKPLTDQIGGGDAKFEEGFFSEVVKSFWRHQETANLPAEVLEATHTWPPIVYSRRKEMPLSWTKQKPLTALCLQKLANVIKTSCKEIDSTVSFTVRLEGWAGSPRLETPEGDAALSAFSPRSTTVTALLRLQSTLPIPASNLQFIENAWKDMRTCASDRVYVGYRARELGFDQKSPTGEITVGFGGGAPAANAAYHGADNNYLAVTSALYDPDNTFWYPQAFRKLNHTVAGSI